MVSIGGVMSLKINFTKGYLHFDLVVAVIRRDSKRNIVYNSGLLYLTNKNYRKLIEETSHIDGIEYCPVQVYDSVENNYPREKKPGHTWCPYCMKNERWSSQHNCPVCGMSDSEFWIRKFNS